MYCIGGLDHKPSFVVHWPCSHGPFSMGVAKGGVSLEAERRQALRCPSDSKFRGALLPKAAQANTVDRATQRELTWKGRRTSGPMQFSVIVDTWWFSEAAKADYP